MKVLRALGAGLFALAMIFGPFVAAALLLFYLASR